MALLVFTEVHNDPENRRQEALRMGANIISYVFSN